MKLDGNRKVDRFHVRLYRLIKRLRDVHLTGDRVVNSAQMVDPSWLDHDSGSSGPSGNWTTLEPGSCFCCISRSSGFFIALVAPRLSDQGNLVGDLNNITNQVPGVLYTSFFYRLLVALRVNDIDHSIFIHLSYNSLCFLCYDKKVWVVDDSGLP